MVYSVRMQCGRVLARETSVEADLVSSVPESGTAAAHGYSQEVRFVFNCYRKLIIVKKKLIKITFP